MADVFTPGDDLVVREVLHRGLWAHWPERVVSDDGPDGVLATFQPAGSTTSAVVTVRPGDPSRMSNFRDSVTAIAVQSNSDHGGLMRARSPSRFSRSPASNT